MQVISERMISLAEIQKEMAEEVGFEPTDGFPSTVFKTAAFNHSAIPPFNIVYTIFLKSVNSIYNKKI